MLQVGVCSAIQCVVKTFCRKDDDWKLSRGVYIFVIFGLLLLLGAISAVIVVVKPWTVSGFFYASLNFLVLKIFVQNLLTCFFFPLNCYR